MLDDLIKAYGDKFLVAALGVSLALLCLFIVLWILRNRAPSPFVRGGRNRQPRLQVLDAAAIDTRRRIVLIRRDNVEHLVMIGGPTDLVIESGIGDERPYLSARPVTQVTEEDHSALPNTIPSDPAPPATLAAAERPAPMIAAPAAAATTATSPAPSPVRRQPVAEQTRTEPTAPLARPTPVAPPAAEPNPVLAVSARPAESITAKTTAAAASPTAAASTVLTPAAVASAPEPVEPVQPVVPEGPAMQTIQHPERPGSPPISVKPTTAQPTANLEPMMSVRADTKPTEANFEPIKREPQMVEVAAVSQPRTTAGTPPIETFRMEPVEPVMRHEVQTAPQDDDRYVARSEPAPVHQPVINAPAAEDLLEAARQRVLAPMPAPVVDQHPQRPAPAADFAPSIDDNEAPRRDMSDFERVLEEEMALHLSAEPASAMRPAPTVSPILPETRADRPRPPVSTVLNEGNRPAAGQNPVQTGEEPNLQNEIARIFGEMSASRNP